MIGADEMVTPAAVSDPSRELVSVVKRPHGRPRAWSEELAYELCDRIGRGRPLEVVCDEDQDMPSSATVYRWLRTVPGFRDVYYDALFAKFDKMAHECITIADDGARDIEVTAEVNAETGVTTHKIDVKGETIERTKLRLGERHRMMAKELPHKYGDHQPLPAQPPNVLNLTVSGPGAPGDNAKLVGGNTIDLTTDPVLRAIAGYVAEEAAQK